MPKPREHDEIDDAEIQPPSIKRARRLLPEQEHGQGPPLAPFTSSVQLLHSSHSSGETLLQDSNINTQDTSPYDHVPHSSEASHFPDPHHLSSPISRSHSGIDVNHISDSYDSPSSSVHIPSGI